MTRNVNEPARIGASVKRFRELEEEDRGEVIARLSGGSPDDALEAKAAIERTHRSLSDMGKNYHLQMLQSEHAAMCGDEGESPQADAVTAEDGTPADLEAPHAR